MIERKNSVQVINFIFETIFCIIVGIVVSFALSITKINLKLPFISYVFKKPLLIIAIVFLFMFLDEHTNFRKNKLYSYFKFGIVLILSSIKFNSFFYIYSKHGIKALILLIIFLIFNLCIFLIFDNYKQLMRFSIIMRLIFAILTFIYLLCTNIEINWNFISALIFLIGYLFFVSNTITIKYTKFCSLNTTSDILFCMLMFNW